MISVLTPVHAKSTPFLREAYESLQAQTYRNFEWVLVPNNGGAVPVDIASQPWVKVGPTEDDNPDHNSIGRLKRFAASHASGQILLELDADDLLTPDALATVAEAFEDAGVAMVYSNCAEFQHGTWQPHTYSPAYGWHSRPFEWGGHQLLETVSPPPTAHSFRSVLFAPNHVRAWRAADYWAVGGHDATLKTGDDHELCCRFYVAYGGHRIKHIDQGLYLYRCHGQNSSQTHNGDVHAQVERNYVQYSRAMIERWARDEGLPMLDLGGRLNSPPGYVSVDIFGADICVDLNEPWPFADGSVGVLRASHVFEHLRNPIHAMNEAWRVLAPGGWLLVEVPSTDGRGAFQDPTHVSFWNENSFWYYTRQSHSRFIPAFTGRFQASRIVTYDPFGDPTIPVVQADLIALKDGYTPMGEVLI